MKRGLLGGLLWALLAGAAQGGQGDPESVEAGQAAAKRPSSRPVAGMLGVIQPPDLLTYGVGHLEGELTSELVSDALEKRLPRLRACLARDQRVTGLIEVIVQVTRPGRVTARWRPGFKPGAAAICLQRQLQQLDLRRRGRAEVTLRVRTLEGFAAGGGGRIGGVAIGGGRIGGLKSAPEGYRGEVMMGPTLSREEISTVIRAHLKEVQFCYEQELLKNPALEGKVLMQFTIGADGKVSSAQVGANALGNPKVGECLVRRIRSWVFPPPRGGGVVKVSYPFVFRTEDRGP